MTQRSSYDKEIKKIENQISKLSTKLIYLQKQKLLNCKHDYRYYHHESDNYDRDISTGYVCSKCKSDLSVKQYKETEHYKEVQRKEEKEEGLRQFKRLQKIFGGESK